MFGNNLDSEKVRKILSLSRRKPIPDDESRRTRMRRDRRIPGAINPVKIGKVREKGPSSVNARVVIFARREEHHRPGIRLFAKFSVAFHRRFPPPFPPPGENFFLEGRGK